jgi:hypothetical protein
MKPYVRKISTIQGKYDLLSKLKTEGFTELKNPNINPYERPLYFLIDPELALYSMCTAEKAKEYEK